MTTASRGGGPLSRGAARGAGDLARAFSRGRPFRHVVIDSFLDAGFARAVAAELPPADSPRFGEGRDGGDGVAICRRPGALGPASARLDAYTRSAPFLAWLSAVAGVAGLRRNLAPTCGGLFRYAAGSEMDVHVDANDVDVHCAQSGHRRKINLLLYLTPGWRPSWGGRLELYADPSRPAARAVAPLFNRCVLFDSHDDSWHGVAPVNIPTRAAGASRLVLILNFYSRRAAGARPQTRHYNILIPRPLPARLRAGARLSLADLLEAARLLARRDARIGHLRALADAAEDLRRGRRPAQAPAPADARFEILRRIPLGLKPGRVLSARQYAALRRLFDGKNRELRRLYAGQLEVVAALKAAAPGLVPRGY